MHQLGGFFFQRLLLLQGVQAINANLHFFGELFHLIIDVSVVLRCGLPVFPPGTLRFRHESLVLALLLP